MPKPDTTPAQKHANYIDLLQRYKVSLGRPLTPEEKVNLAQQVGLDPSEVPGIRDKEEEPRILGGSARTSDEWAYRQHPLVRGRY